jgi:single-strand DNA-binding protein
MSHTVTAKLNQAARQHQGQAGTTFFVSLGEKNYDFKNKTNVYTNYDAALFAKEAQVGFYASALVEGAIVSVTGSGIVLDDSNKEYKPKLAIQDAKLEFVHSPQGVPQQAAPQQQQGFQQSQQQQQQYNQAPQQQAPYNPGDGFNNNTPPF